MACLVHGEACWAKAEKPDGWPVLVKALRDAAVGIDVAAEQTGDMTIYFPPKEKGESQPIVLKGDIPLSYVGDLVHYIADMLEQ